MLVALAIAVASCRGGTRPEPRIDAIEPNTVAHGSALAATISGDNFHTGLSVEVDTHAAARVNRVFSVWLGSTLVAKSSVEYVDRTTLEVEVPASLSVGVYDLKVTTPAGRSATLRDALTVFDTSAPQNDAAIVDAAVEASPEGGPAAGGAGADATGGTTATTENAGNSGDSAGAGGPPIDFGQTGGAPTAGTGGAAAGGMGGAVAVGAMGGAAGQAVEGGSAGSGVTTVDAHTTLWTDGRLLRDTCGQTVTLRGLQQMLGNDLPSENDWAGLMDEIAATGANAVRIHADTDAMTTADIDAVLGRLRTHGVIAIVTTPSHEWLGDANNHAMLVKHTATVMLDVWGPAYDDRARFATDAQAAITEVRAFGYEEPLVVLSNQYGRDLPALLEYGDVLVEADPLHNVVFEWDAYWGSSNWYQDLYGMTLSEGIAQVATASFPVVMGLIHYTEGSVGETLDYAEAMTLAQDRGVSWVWWDWCNPFNAVNSLSADCSRAGLTQVGIDIVQEHSAGIANTSTLACVGQ